MEADAAGAEGHSYSKWAGFIDGVDRFDPLFFNISPLDAEVMDPQERLFLETAWAALEQAGYQVASFDNGLSAYHRLREEPFELLLTDIVMPEMDGIELARRATELDPDIKVMFITGFAAVALNPDNNAPREAKILSKPFHLKDLVNEVQRLLAA